MPTLLVVDDVATDRLRIAGLAARWMNSIVLQAADGATALTMIEQHQPDIVLTDLHMPEMDGFTILEKMKSSETLRDVPVIVVSGGDLTPEQQQQLQDFGHRMIQKNALNEKQLLTTLERVLERVKH